MIAIPKAASVAHVKENAGALTITLAAKHLEALDRAFPPPQRKTVLDSALYLTCWPAAKCVGQRGAALAVKLPAGVARRGRRAPVVPS